MSLDINIVLSKLETLIEGNVQETLDTTCIPPFGNVYVDHADVTGVTSHVDATANAADFDVSVNIFAVDLPSLEANVNGTPPGAIIPAGVAVIHLQLSVSGTVLQLVCTSVDLPGPYEAMAPALQALVPPISTDLSSFFKQLNIANPTNNKVAEVGGALIISFDPESSAVNHLQAGEDWCFFLDADTMRSLTQSKLSGPLSSLTSHGVTGLNETINWNPAGITPHIDIVITGKFPVPNPFTAGITLNLGIDFDLLHVIATKLGFADEDLELLVTWGLSVDLGEFVPGFVETLVENKIKSYFNPASFGGTALGPNEFSIDEGLPLVQFGGATFEYNSIIGLQDGMVLGGSIEGIITVTDGAFSYSVNAFPQVYIEYGDCISGRPPGPTTINDISTLASASFQNAGMLCSVTQESPSTSSVNLAPYISTIPAADVTASEIDISIKLSGFLGVILNAIGKDVILLVKTTRGTRMVNFGLTPAAVMNGNTVTNVIFVLLRNCPGQPVPWWQEFHSYNPKWSIDPPIDYLQNIEQVVEFQSVVMRVAGLESGELLTFDQPGMGMSVFSAGTEEALYIPAILPTRSIDAPAVLASVSRQSLQVTQSVFLFQRVAVLQTPRALSHELSEEHGSAKITTTYQGHIEQTRIDRSGIIQKLQSQRLDNKDSMDDNLSVGDEADEEVEHNNPIFERGFIQTKQIPGFEGSQLSVGQMDDGTFVILSHHEGKQRVAGFVPDWPDMPATAGKWAISSDRGDRIAVFTVKQLSAFEGCDRGKKSD